MRHGCYWAAAAVIVAGQLAAAKRYPVSSSFGALEVDGEEEPLPINTTTDDEENPFSSFRLSQNGLGETNNKNETIKIIKLK